jgi:RimJ/RimL family protein N-acetyltransferase
MIDVPSLETERLIMRSFKSDDFEPMAAFFAGADSFYYGGPLDRSEAWRRLATFAGHWVLNGYGEFALEEKATGAFVGFCGPWKPAGATEPEIAWALLPDYYGKGYAGEAAKRAIKYVYEDLKWSTVMSLIESGNTSSVRLAERLGAKAETSVEIYGREAVIYRHLPPTAFAEQHV